MRIDLRCQGHTLVFDVYTFITRLVIDESPSEVQTVIAERIVSSSLSRTLDGTKVAERWEEKHFNSTLLALI